MKSFAVALACLLNIAASASRADERTDLQYVRLVITVTNAQPGYPLNKLQVVATNDVKVTGTAVFLSDKTHVVPLLRPGGSITISNTATPLKTNASPIAVNFPRNYTLLTDEKIDRLLQLTNP